MEAFLKRETVKGHFLALLFFIAVGYFFYSAASNMNYIWKWNSIPKYFAYEEFISVEAPIDGKLIIENDKYFIDGDEKIELKNISKDFDFKYKINESVYEGDIVASKEEMKVGPIIDGLWVTLKISFFASILTISIGILVALMSISSSVFLRRDQIAV